VPSTALLRPTEALVHVDRVEPSHAPGETVLHLRGAGPVPFGERGVVVAVQGARVEVMFEREGLCSRGHFAQLSTRRAAVLPASALLNLTRPPREKASARASASAGAFGALGTGEWVAGETATEALDRLRKHGNPYAVLDQAPE